MNVEHLTLIGEVPQGRGKVIRVLVDTRAPGTVVIREWFMAEDGEMRPGKGGLSIPAKHFGAFVEGLKTQKPIDGYIKLEAPR